MINKRGKDFLVVDADTGKTLGTHASFQKAVKQEYAIAKNQGKGKAAIQELIDESVKRNYKKAAVSHGYVALKVSKKDSKMLSSILKDIGITDAIAPDKLHMTLMYDKSETAREYKPVGGSYKAKIIGCDKLGEKGSEWEAVVIKLSSPEIDARHKALKDQGYKHSYDKLIQHVSLKYKPADTDLAIIKKAISTLKASMPEITLDREYTESLTDEQLTKKHADNNHMSFPRSETSQLRGRLKDGKHIFTTRVDAEKGKYKLHDLVNSRLGKLRVTEVKHINKLNAHPFLQHLTDKNKEDIGDKPMDLLKLEKVAGLTHYQHGDSTITPSLAQLSDTDPEKANEVLQRLITEGYRKPGYLGQRKEVEMLLRMQAANLGIDAKNRYPTYATLGSPTDPTIFRGESSVNLPLDVLKDRTTFTIGDSFRVLGKTPDGNKRDLVFPSAMSYDEVQKVMESPEMQAQLRRAGKGGYIEAQIWDDQTNLEKLVKTAMIKLRPFKELKTPWYKKLLSSKLAPNNPDIQSALRSAMPGNSGRLHNIVRELSDRSLGTK